MAWNFWQKITVWTVRLCLGEWNSLTNMMSDLDQAQTAGPKAILNIIRQLKPAAADFCLNMEELCYIAVSLPGSTAEVFSDISRTVSHRLKVGNIHKLLMIHRNDQYLSVESVVKRWLSKSYRKIKLVYSYMVKF